MDIGAPERLAVAIRHAQSRSRLGHGEPKCLNSCVAICLQFSVISRYYGEQTGHRVKALRTSLESRAPPVGCVIAPDCKACAHSRYALRNL